MEVDERGPNKLSETIGNEEVREKIHMMVGAIKTHHEHITRKTKLLKLAIDGRLYEQRCRMVLPFK